MKKYLIIFAIIIFTSVSSFADEVFLKQSVMVDDEYIKLSDIFTGITVEQDKKIAPSPAPGKQSHFDNNTLSSIARRNSVSWQPNSDYEKVSVTRDYQTISNEEIFEAIKASEFFFDKIPNDSQIESRTLKNIDVAKNIDYDIEIVNGNYSESNSNFRAEVSIKQKSITEISEIVGKEARKTLKPWEILTTNDVKTPVLVEKSKMVKVIYKKNNMTLSYVGKALEDGSKGDFIRFQSAAGTDVLQGVVTGVNTVLVSTSADI